MIDKPLKDKLVDLLKGVLDALTGENDDESLKSEEDKENTDGSENSEEEEEKEPIEPEFNGGFAGF